MTPLPPEARFFGDRLMANVELLGTLEGIAYLEAALSEEFAPLSEAAAFDAWALARVKANITRELAHRDRLFQAGHLVPNPTEAQHDAWLILAREVRQRTSVVDLLCRIGHAPHGPLGWSNRRQAHEYHSSCPFCNAGFDRFVSWHGESEPDGYWCRRCGNAGDVITLARAFLPGCDSFYRAVAELARDLGLPLPTAQRSPRPTHRHVVTLTPKGGQHAL